jgi:hypothetical protein
MIRNYLPVLILLLFLTGCEKNRNPRACFTLPHDKVITNTRVAPDNCSENASEYLWDDGNGNQYNNFEPVFTYQDPDKYCVTLIAYSENGEEVSMVTDSVEVNPPSGEVTFWQNGSIQYSPQVKVSTGSQTETITNFYPNGIATCDMPGCANFTLTVGTHTFYAWSGSTEWGPFTVEIEMGKCKKFQLW